MTAEGGFEVAFHGEYREIVAAHRSSPPRPSRPVARGRTRGEHRHLHRDRRRTTLTLAEVGSKEERDAILATGMETGMQEQMDLLEQIARSLD